MSATAKTLINSAKTNRNIDPMQVISGLSLRGTALPEYRKKYL